MGYDGIYNNVMVNMMVNDGFCPWLIMEQTIIIWECSMVILFQDMICY